MIGTKENALVDLKDLSPLLTSALVQCSLFKDSFTPEAVENILWLNEYDPSCWPLDVVEELVQQGLIETFDPLPHHTRYSLTTDGRNHAAHVEDTQPTPTLDQVKSRHADYYARFGSEQRVHALNQHGGEHRLHILMFERENLHSGLQHAIAHRESQSAAGLLLAYSALINLQGPPVLLTEFCEQVLAANSLGDALNFRLHIQYAHALRTNGRVNEGRGSATRALAIAKQINNPKYEAIALSCLGIIALQQGNTQLALDSSQQALSFHQRLGNRQYEGILQAEMGILHKTMGNLEQARTYHEEALLIHREVGNRRFEGVAVTNLALLNAELGHLTVAAELYEEAIDLLRETTHRRLEGCALGNLGDLYLNDGNFTEAREHLETAVEIAREVGSKVPEGAFLGSLSELHRRQGNLDQARTCIAQAETLMRGANDAIELTKVLCRKGWLEIAERQFEAAVHTSKESQGLIEHLGISSDNSLAVSIVKLSQQAKVFS